MTLSNFLKSTSQLLAVFLTIQQSPSQANNINVCLAGNAVAIYSKYGEAFINGAKIALSEKPTPKSVPFNIKKYFYDFAANSPVKAFNKMKKENCQFIIGFNNSNDLMRVESLAEKSNIPVMSIYGNLTDQKENGRILSLQAAPETKAKFFSNYLVEQKFLFKKKIVLFSTPDRISLSNYYNHFKNELINRKIDFEYVAFAERGFSVKSISPTEKEKLFSADVIVFFTRSVVAAQTVDFIYQNSSKNKPFIIGTESFGSAQMPAFLFRSKAKNVKGLVMRQTTLLKKDAGTKIFFERYKRTFKTVPFIISAYAYDLMNFIQLTMKRFGQKPAQEDLLKAVLESEYKGLSGVRIRKGFRTDHENFYVLRIKEDQYEFEDTVEVKP